MESTQLAQQSMNAVVYNFAICILIAVLFQPWKRAIWRYWAVAIIFTIGGIIATVHVISLASTPQNLATARGEVTRSAADTQAIVVKRLQLEGKCVIPTGVQVQGFKFETSLDLEMHGYIWQTYPSNCPAALQGFTVPEASDGGFARREIRRQRNADGSETALFQFSTTQRQLFNYEQYPFDYQTLWLRLWSLDFNGSAVLVPDFNSYPKWVDGLKLGIDPDAEIGGFVLDFTRWSLFFPPTQTSFGQGAYDSPPVRVGLYYNVGFHRLLVGPFVNHLVPIIVVTLLSYSALLFVHTDGDRATTVLTFIGALLFAAMINQQGIRASVDSAGFTVADLYCMINYGLLLLVSLIAILVAKTNVAWFERNDGLFFKALFPAAAAWLFAVVTRWSLLVS
jgi:hypothetical protein